MLAVVAACASTDPTLAGGLLTQAPVPTLGTNVVANSGFESGVSGWTLGGCWAVERTVAHSGTQSLKYTAGSNCAAYAASDLARPVGSARAYTLRFWVRSASTTRVQARVCIHDLVDNDYTVTSTVWTTAPGTWTMIQLPDIDLLPVHDGHGLEIRLEAKASSGSLWFDDVQLIQEIQPPLTAFLLYPNFRGYLWSDQSQTIRLQTNVNLTSLTGLVVKASLQYEGGATISTNQALALPSQEIDFSASSLPNGRYLINTWLVNASGATVATYPQYRVTKVDPSFRASLNNYIDVDNFLVHQGQKQFVWGVYDRFSTVRCSTCLFQTVTGYETGITGFANTGTIADYQATKTNVEMNISPFAGVNPNSPTDQLTPWLSALDAYGVGHLQIVNNWVKGNKYRPGWASSLSDPQLWQVGASMMDGKKGATGYYTYDEPKTASLPVVYAQYQTLRENNPGSVTFGVLVNARSIYRWRDESDVVGSDPYPVGDPAGVDDAPYGATTAPPMIRTAVWTLQTERQVNSARPVWMVLQLFRHNGQFPSYNQMKSQAYAAIVSGAQGILWWGFVSAQGVEHEWFYNNDQAAYYNYQRLSGEVMGMEPFLISPAQPTLLASTSNSNIQTLVKANSTQIVIFTFNRSQSPVSNVVFTLPTSVATTGSTVNVYSESRTVPLSAGAFTDSFAGYDAHVYVIQR